MMRWHILAAWTVCSFVATARGGDTVDFSREILPLLSDKCFHCHGPDPLNRKAKLRLDDERNVKTERAVVVPGQSAESELYRRLVTTDHAEVMPPRKANRQLTPPQIALVKRWIDQGAKWGGHWAFNPVVRPAVPGLADVRGRNPIDAFVLERLHKEKLPLAPAAGRETLLRRVSLDLTGLPPTLAEVEAFVNDPADGAYERAVDRLLASSAFGERMAWDWLDAARYADSNGYQGDGDRTMWPWRDWVVQAFNRNLPYDQFTVWQLAGDLLPQGTPEQKLATGFCRNHMINGEGGRIPEENRVDYVMDMSETTGTVWLGLTFNCCRCHDHKYDPLSRRDYYRMFAFFNQTPVDGGSGNPQTAPVVEMGMVEQTARLAQLSTETQAAAKALDDFERTFFPRPKDKSADASDKAAQLPGPLKAILKNDPAKRNANQLTQLEKQWEKDAPAYVKTVKALRSAVEARESARQAIPRVMVMEDLKQPRKSFMLDKGAYDKPGEVVTAAVPAKLPPLPKGAPDNRLGLAQWLVAPENPLTARVTVNRLWQQFFGVGLVKTTEDFGIQAEKPSHPELLDWLAAEFVASGWDVKHLCRLIVTSATYRQSSQASAALHERDPHNRLLARGPRGRLPSWMLRDQALAVSGLLVERNGGPPVRPYQPTGIWEEATFGNKRYIQDHGAALYRRSLYVFWRRIVGPTMFFDTASRQTCAVKTSLTNTPLHALVTLNDVTYVEAARALAQRVLTTAGPRSAERVALAYRHVLSHQPTPAETALLVAAIARARGEFAQDTAAARKLLAVGESKRNEALDPVEHAAYTVVCSTILNLDAALTKD